MLLGLIFISERVALIGLRSSRKTERYLLHIHGLILKKNPLTLPSLFRDDARDGYNGKPMKHSHIYAYEGEIRHHHTIY